MDPVASIAEKLRGFAKSTQDLVDGVLHWRRYSFRRSPLEILKRLQREAFSDIMKLRDRQDKVERMLSFYKSSKGSPFQEASTLVKGEVDVLGVLLMTNNVDEQKCDAIRRAGIRTGIDSRFTFETTIRQKDTLIAEFVASERDQNDIFSSPLSLARLLYAANVSDWLSAVAIPVGARCIDVGITTNSSHQGKGLTDYSFLGPPLLNQHNGSAIGLMVRKSNVTASLAQFISGKGVQSDSAGSMHWFSTFGQVVCQFPRNTKLSLLGIHHVPKLSSQPVSLGAMAMPVGIFRRRAERFVETSGLSNGNREGNVLAGSIALMLESELDESTGIGGWVEMKKSNPRYLQWAVNMYDTPEDDFGWGLTLGGSVQGPTHWDHFQVETFLKFNIGKRFSFQPALLYVMDGTTQFPALMFRSTWSI